MNNFHGRIALPLETIAKEKNVTLFGRAVTADSIEAGNFAEIMLAILLHEKKDDKEFIANCQVFKGKPASEIPFEKAEELFNDFKFILGQPMLDNKRVITTCPSCGEPITEATDANNGFCIKCTQEEEVD